MIRILNRYFHDKLSNIHLLNCDFYIFREVIIILICLGLAKDPELVSYLIDVCTVLKLPVTREFLSKRFRENPYSSSEFLNVEKLWEVFSVHYFRLWNPVITVTNSSNKKVPARNKALLLVNDLNKKQKSKKKKIFQLAKQLVYIQKYLWPLIVIMSKIAIDNYESNTICPVQ